MSPPGPPSSGSPSDPGPPLGSGSQPPNGSSLQASSRLQAVLGAALIVMGGFVASKLLGLVRNIVISHQYGASREYELFLAGISIPDTVFQVLAGGAVGAAFIPVFTSYFASAESHRAWRLTSALMNLAVVGIGAFALLLGLAIPMLVGVLVPGWSTPEQQQVANLTRLMMVSPVIFAVSTLATSALNGVHRFALAAAAPLMYNLALIAGATVLRPLGVEGLALSAVAGALLHLAIQIPGLMRVGMRYSLTLGLDLEGTREVARLMGPRVLGLGVSQLNLLANVALASLLVEGSIAYLSYAWLVLMVPLGVFGMGFATAVFPTLVEQAAQAREEEQQRTFVFALRLILYVTIPAAVGVMVLARPTVGLLYERGAFDAAAAAATAYALAWYALGLPGHALIEIVVRAFYAERDTSTPVRVAAVGAALNIALSLLLMRTGLSYAGLALANAVAALCEASLLIAIFQRRRRWLRLGELFGFGGRVAVAAVFMAGVAWLVVGSVAPHIDATHWTGQMATVLIVASTSVLAYLSFSLALGVDDGRRAANLLLHRP